MEKGDEKKGRSEVTKKSDDERVTQAQ